jgi:hypothetical protein
MMLRFQPPIEAQGLVNAIVTICIFNMPVFALIARPGELALWPRELGRAACTAQHLLPNTVSL